MTWEVQAKKAKLQQLEVLGAGEEIKLCTVSVDNDEPEIIENQLKATRDR